MLKSQWLVLLLLSFTLNTGCAEILGGMHGFKLENGSEKRSVEAFNKQQSLLLQEAYRMAYDGRCPQLEDQIAKIAPTVLSVPGNAAGIQASRITCEMNWYGRLGAARSLGLAAMKTNSVNWSHVTNCVARTHLLECDFDKAADYSYQAVGKWPAYLTAGILIEMAGVYVKQGRVPLAIRNCQRYLETYPADWYQTAKANPPSGVGYDRKNADTFHREARAKAWLIWASEVPSVSIPEAEVPWVKRMMDVSSLFEGMGPDFLNSTASSMLHIDILDTLARCLRIRDKLRLTPKEVEALEVAIDSELTKVKGAEGICQEPVERGIRMANQAIETIPGRAASGPKGDLDSDGVANDLDQCPHQAEVFNGVDDSDGCPDMTRAAIVEKQIVITDTIRFKLDSAELVPESLPTLQSVADVMKAYPQVKQIRIEGHTDSRGTAEHNQRLSEQRARSVLEYLKSAGVDGSRLTYVGFGESYPIAFEETEEAWSANRRVEFLILKADPIQVVE